MDGGAWEASVHGVAKRQTRLSNFTFTVHFHALEKEILAWRIPGTGEPGGLPSMGSHRVGHNWSDLAAAVAADSDGFSKESIAQTDKEVREKISIEGSCNDTTTAFIQEKNNVVWNILWNKTIDNKLYDYN